MLGLILNRAPRPVCLRAMDKFDAGPIAEIARRAHGRPYREYDFDRALAVPGTDGVVAVLSPGNALVLGYCLWNEDPYRGTLMVMDLAVHPNDRLRGVGRLLVAHVASLLGPRGLHRAEFFARESETPGHLFLRKLGWRAVAVRRAWFRETGEDAYQFVLGG